MHITPQLPQVTPPPVLSTCGPGAAYLVNYGFLIDHRKCIGCHACSTACKSENEVPLGVYRTWVKYVEKGEFPNVRRSFQVTRCNHCANPPCVRICPVTAMYQRRDGIVEFDARLCIGCKACLQACPYDAIYIDPETHTAAKCHYCAHRIEVGLEPACVVVCPEHAILSGDLNDPTSEISRFIRWEQVSVRKPEQGTAPKLFYINADEVTLSPTAPHQGNSYMWADLITEQTIPTLNHNTKNNGNQSAGINASSEVSILTPSFQGLGSRQGPIMIGEGTMADHMVQTGYNAQHKIPWHWPVPAYLVTKSIGSGAFMMLTLLIVLGENVGALFELAIQFTTVVFIGITTLLLVFDLEKPGRFLTILTRPQWRSWLTRGAFILIGFSSVVGIGILANAAVFLELLSDSSYELIRPIIHLLGFPLAVLSAMYTAFLFGQAEGRDFWQSALLPFHLVLQALMAGCAALILLGCFLPPFENVWPWLFWALVLALVISLFITLTGELGMPHASEIAARAAHMIRHGKYRRYFWGGAILVGHLIPLAIMGIFALVNVFIIPLLVLPSMAVLIGLYLYEYAYVMAPQEIPNS